MMTFKPHYSPSICLSSSTHTEFLHLAQSLQKTSNCKSILQSSVSSFLQNERLFFLPIERRTLEHFCHITELRADPLYVHNKNMHMYN